jgi:iron complex transport system ATP-binding protein
MRLDTIDITVELQAKRIVQDVTLHVESGEVVGLIGPNGSGKSTLLRTVYRMLKPVAGYVLFDGENVWNLSIRESAKRIGIVVQEMPTDFEFTVYEIVRMGRNPHKGMLSFENERDLKIVDESLARVNMKAFAERQFSNLSGGEKQRVLIARALTQEPKVLVMDEPTNHLDINNQLDLLELVKGLGITVFMTLHDMNLAASYCRRLYVLSEGRIVASGTPEEVLTKSLLRTVFRVDAVVGRHPQSGCPCLAFTPLSHNGISGESPELEHKF